MFDILGREIVTLVNEEQVSGVYEVHFDGKGLNSGVYYCKLNVGNYMNVKKMILLK